MYKFATYLFFLTGLAQLSALQPVTNISAANGFRRDEVSTFINATDAIEFPDLPGNVFLTDDLKFKRLNIYEIGVEGTLAVPTCWTNGECFLSQFYLEGYAYWGKVYDGHFHVRDESFDPDDSGVFTNSGKARSGTTHNYKAGIGYLFCINECLGISPVVGYSWDRLKARASHVVDETGAFPQIRQDLTYTTKWRGPYLGVNLAYDLNCFRFGAGYEYHWSRFRASFDLAFPDDPDANCSGFSDRRRANRAYGNVVWLSGSWFFCECWDLSIRGKYSHYKARNGREIPRAGSFEAVGCSPTEVDKISSAKWKSWEVTGSLGYNF
jgi:hypothetical protein